MADQCVTNPVPASQVVDVNLDWLGLTQPECTDLIDTLQTILSSLDALENAEIDTSCLEPEEETLPSVLQAVVDLACANSEALSTTPTQGEETDQEGLNINYCQPDTFDCDAELCINVDPCSDVPTLEEQMQAMASRLISLSSIVKSQCDLIADLTTQINTPPDDCCDLTQLESRMANVESQLTNINNNCC